MIQALGLLTIGFVLGFVAAVATEPRRDRQRERTELARHPRPDPRRGGQALPPLPPEAWTPDPRDVIRPLPARRRPGRQNWRNN